MLKISERFDQITFIQGKCSERVLLYLESLRPGQVHQVEGAATSLGRDLVGAGDSEQVMLLL